MLQPNPLEKRKKTYRFSGYPKPTSPFTAKTTLATGENNQIVIIRLQQSLTAFLLVYLSTQTLQTIDLCTGMKIQLDLINFVPSRFKNWKQTT